MPLCPQITITPITVTSTGMVETSVVAAADPATTEQLAVTTASASSAAAAAASAQAAAAAAAAASAAASAQAVAAAATAAAASATATAAQATATAAQASATNAFNTAVAANTAASTAQTTADGKNKVTYSTATPGTTSNTVGDIWYQYGTVSPNIGRVIAQYIGAGTTNWTQTTVSGLVIANIDAASITTGTLSVALGITGTLGNFTVNAVTGALFANSATIKGAVQAESGYFGSPTNGFSISATGLVGVGTGTIVGGIIQGATFINGSGTFSVSTAGVLIAQQATIDGTIRATAGFFGDLTNGFSIGAGGLTGYGTGSITGGAITGATFTNGSTFSVSAGGVLAASSGTIGGSTLASSTITGGTIQTSTGAAALILNGTSNALQFKANGSVVANMLPLDTGTGAYGLLMHTGATPDPTGGTRPQMFIGSGSLSLQADTSNVLSVATTGISVGGAVLVNAAGTITLANQTNYTGIASGTGSAVVLVGTSSRLAFVSSSRKSKSNIETLTGTFVDKLLALEAVSFDWKNQPADMPYRKNYGFIAEDVASLTSEIESIVNYNEEDEPVSISYDRLCTFLVLAIQELKAEINILKGA